MPTRYSPDSLGLAVTEVITKPKKHSHRRLVTSFIVLRFLYEAAKHGRIARGGEILALGSTLQGRKGGVGAGNQFAHQVLRELSIDEVPLHLIAALTARESIVFTYCHASVSQIAARYNETDQLVEQRARTPFIQLAERAINAGVSLQLVDTCMRSLWDDLLDMYEKCCKDSEAAATLDQKGVLKEYLAAVASARKNPLILVRKLDPNDPEDYNLFRPIYQVALDDWYANIIDKKIKLLGGVTELNHKQKCAEVLLRLRRELADEVEIARARMVA